MVEPLPSKQKRRGNNRLMDGETKQCTDCGRTLPVADFHWRYKDRGIRRSDCKECWSVKRKRYYQRNADREKQNTLKRRRRLFAWFREYKKTLKCARCGEDHPAALDFHHKDPSRKEVRLSQVVTVKGWGVERMKREIANCEVLCANRHRKEHWEDHAEARRAFEAARHGSQQ